MSRPWCSTTPDRPDADTPITQTLPVTETLPHARARRRRTLACALWIALAFAAWNVRFDEGVRITARSYLAQRTLYLRGEAPRIEMASAMRDGIRASARAATLLALPLAGVAVWLAASRRSR